MRRRRRSSSRKKVVVVVVVLLLLLCLDDVSKFIIIKRERERDGSVHDVREKKANKIQAHFIDNPHHSSLQHKY